MTKVNKTLAIIESEMSILKSLIENDDYQAVVKAKELIRLMETLVIRLRMELY